SGPTGWVGSESHGRCPDDIIETIAEARDLAATQASLRRLALLVAEGAAPETVFAAVTHEALRHRAARVEDYGTLAGGEPYTREGLHSAVGMPIHVHGRLWGMIAVGSASPDLPL